ncbi:MAG: ribose 5-phosphate isomerase B [Micavibrio sp.]|nr:MAG: ribose 5-phosphate isomerase B [Micavibrio sp.]
MQRFTKTLSIDRKKNVPNKKLRIALAADHGGITLKTHLAAFLKQEGHDVTDLGTDDSGTSVDYPDFGFKAAACVAEGAVDFGIIICGTGIGISIAANRNPAIRAALCHDTTTARLAREHNDANILALGERVLGTITAEDILRVFLATEFEGGRHARRVEKLSCPPATEKKEEN